VARVSKDGHVSMVRDARLRRAPHHEGEHSSKLSPHQRSDMRVDGGDTRMLLCSCGLRY
jgi:hypothetical protein